MMKTPEKFRVTSGGIMASSAEYGNNGYFLIPNFLRDNTNEDKLHVIISDGIGWEYVSVTLDNRTPTWDEMCMVKDLFWDDEDCVVQYHPPKSEYINNHQFCLHLWRPKEVAFLQPPSILVGTKYKYPELH